MTVVEGEISIKFFLKVQISGIEGAERVVKFVHNYEEICVELFW